MWSHFPFSSKSPQIPTDVWSGWHMLNESQCSSSLQNSLNPHLHYMLRYCAVCITCSALLINVKYRFWHGHQSCKRGCCRGSVPAFLENCIIVRIRKFNPYAIPDHSIQCTNKEENHNWQIIWGAILINSRCDAHHFSCVKMQTFFSLTPHVCRKEWFANFLFNKKCCIIAWIMLSTTNHKSWKHL